MMDQKSSCVKRLVLEDDGMQSIVEPIMTDNKGPTLEVPNISSPRNSVRLATDTKDMDDNKTSKKKGAMWKKRALSRICSLWNDSGRTCGPAKT